MLDVDRFGLVDVNEVHLIHLVISSVNASSHFHVVFHLLSELTLERWDHGLGNLEHLKAVFQVLEGGLSVLHSPILLLDECLLLSDVFLNFFEKQVDGFSLVVLNSFKLEKEALNVLWRRDLNVILFALG
jgi:hypothetical protein